MVDFGNLQSFQVTRDTVAELSLSIPPLKDDADPVLLLVRPATSANKPYFNAMLRRNTKLTSRAARGAKIDANMMDESIQHDRELYPHHVIVGWQNVFDATGAAVSFNTEACKDFVAALPNWVFDEIRSFCGTSSNFIDADTEGKAKN